MSILLLLTGTVNTNAKSFTTLTNSEKREEEYVNTIRYYLNNFDLRIVFVENSNHNFSHLFIPEIENKRLEYLCFNGNDYPTEKGKGLGELNCMEYALKNSTFIQKDPFTIKITGRYKILNLKQYILFIQKKPSLELLADLTNNFKFSASGIFGFKPSVITKYLFKDKHRLNDTNNFFFEHALAKAVLEAIGDGVNFSILKHYPKIQAISGTTGEPYKISFIFRLPRIIKYWIRYFIVIR